MSEYNKQKLLSPLSAVQFEPKIKLSKLFIVPVRCPPEQKKNKKKKKKSSNNNKISTSIYRRNSKQPKIGTKEDSQASRQANKHRQAHRYHRYTNRQKHTVESGQFKLCKFTHSSPKIYLF